MQELREDMNSYHIRVMKGAVQVIVKQKVNNKAELVSKQSAKRMDLKGYGKAIHRDWDLYILLLPAVI